MAAAVAVIIPYFQREPGILARAVRSILQQKACARPHIIVVDDESPVSAESELGEFRADIKSTITVIRQPNRGPSVARNVGLDAVPPDIDWIALLDSDDIWEPDHLATALTALEQGYDLFFADHKRDGLHKTHFELASFNPPKSHAVDSLSSVYDFPEDLFTTALNHSPIGMSTVVMRRSRLGLVRFADDLHLCEDLLYSLELARASKRVAVGHNVQVTYGKGLNMSAVAWDSPSAVTGTLNFSRYCAEVRRRFQLTPQQQAILRLKERANRQTFVRTVLSLVRRGKKCDLSTIGHFMLRNPRTCFDLFQVLGMEVARRTAGGRP